MTTAASSAPDPYAEPLPAAAPTAAYTEPMPAASAEPTAIAAPRSTCPQCGLANPGATRFCGGCGAAQQAPERPMGSAGAPVRPAVEAAVQHAREWQRGLPSPLNAIPLELLGLCALMAAAGLLTLWPAIRILPDIVRAIGAGGFARTFGLLLLTFWVLLALFGLALVYLSWRLAHADRVARGLSYILLGGLAAAILIGREHPGSLVVVMLVCLASLAILAGAPAVRAFFAAADAPDGAQPTSVVIARTLIAVWSGVLIAIGAMFLPLGDLGDRFVPIGLLLIALGAGAWYVSGRIATGDPTARLIISAGAAVYLVLVLVLGERDASTIVPLAMAGGIVWNLWIPQESQRYFESAAAGS